MHTTILADVVFEPNPTIANARIVIIAMISLALLLVTLFGIWLGRRGEPGQNASIVAAVLIALIPGALAVSGIALAFGSAFLGWAIPGLTK